MTLPSTERREFFRVKDRLFVEFREINREESEDLEKNLRGSNSTPGSLGGRVEIGQLDTVLGKNEIYAYLEMLDRKLNMILDLLSRREPAFHGAYLDVVLSGSGLSYVSDIKLEEGAFLEVRVVLPFFPKPRIGALGKVVRSQKCSTGDKEAWETAVSFVTINEKDRDILVGYVFSRERELLRAGDGPRADKG